MRKICVVCAHPDDELYGMGGTLLAHKFVNDDVQIIMITDGERGDGSGEKRRKEFREIHTSLGIKTKIVGVPAQHTDKHRETVFKSLKDLISPDTSIVYTHCSGDLHLDHRIIHEATLHVCRNYSMEIRCYETLPYLYNVFIPNMFVDITPFMDKKCKLLEEYKTEIGVFPNPLSIEGVKRLNGFRGLQIGKAYAEGFILFRKLETIQDMLHKNTKTEMIKNDIIRFYDEKSSEWELNNIDPLRIEINSWFLDNILKKEMKILVIGCGGGALSKYYSDKGCDVISMDISPKMIEHCCFKYGNINPQFLVSDITETYDLGFFDIVMLCDTLEHVVDVEKSIKNSMYMVKHEGYIYITIPHPEYRKARGLEGQIIDNIIDINYLHHKLKGNGFTIISERGYGTDFGKYTQYYGILAKKIGD